MADKVTKDVKDEKSKNLEQALLQIEKAYGKGAIMKLGEDASNQNVDVISTGSSPKSFLGFSDMSSDILCSEIFPVW